MPRDEFEVSVCALGPPGPAAEPLRAAGIAVHSLNWSRLVDWNPVRDLRRLVETLSPSLIHCWGPSSLRFVSLVVGRSCGLVASAVERSRNPAANWLDQQLLKRVDQVIADGAFTAERFDHFGLNHDRVAVIPPGVAPAVPDGAAASHFRKSLDLSEDCRLVFCV